MTQNFGAMADPDRNPQFRRFATGPIRFRSEKTASQVSNEARCKAPQFPAAVPTPGRFFLLTDQGASLDATAVCFP